MSTALRQTPWLKQRLLNHFAYWPCVLTGDDPNQTCFCCLPSPPSLSPFENIFKLNHKIILVRPKKNLLKIPLKHTQKSPNICDHQPPLAPICIRICFVFCLLVFSTFTNISLNIRVIRSRLIYSLNLVIGFYCSRLYNEATFDVA